MYNYFSSVLPWYLLKMSDLKSLSYLAIKRGSKIVSAESCTAGMLAASLTEMPVSSAFFEQGYITYSNRSKISVLGVDKKILEKHGAVSEEVAKQMAEGALNRSMGTIAISVTGIAGPGGSDYKPEGFVCFSIAQNNGEIRVETMEYGPLGRNNIRSSAVIKAIELLHEELSVT